MGEKKMEAIQRLTRRPAVRRSLPASYFVLFVILFSYVAAAQTTTLTRATDGHTPLEIAPGSPAGSYALSDFDNISLFSQSLGFRLPLLGVGGRGAAGYTVTLPIEKKWRVEHKVYDPTVKGGEQFIPEHYYRPVDSWYTALKPGFSPGVMIVRQSGLDLTTVGGACGVTYTRTLTTLTFVGPDGTEYELRDTKFGGEPRPAGCQVGDNRGRIFVTTDGSAATFVADADIVDYVYQREDPESIVLPTSGTLYLRDGTRYHISDNVVDVIRDRNGNEVRFNSVEVQPGVYAQRAVDSLGREVIFNNNEITFKGFGGTPRTMRVLYAPLENRLRQANAEHGAETLKSRGELFPAIPYNDPNAADYLSQPPDSVVSEVILPDNRRYGFRYNSYGELARVELPTGGAFEYDYQGGGLGNGVYTNGMEYEILRQVTAKRIYDEGGRLVNVMSLGACATSYPDSCVAVDQYDPNPSPDAASCSAPAGTNYRLVSRTLHFFHGVPGPGLFARPTYYTKWDEGKEFKTETYACDGVTLLRRVEQEWRQKGPVGWWVNFNSVNDRGNEPANDPRVIETVTTLADSGQIAKTTSVDPRDGTRQTVRIDQYNNPTDVWEYDYGEPGSGSPGAFLRRQHTDYLNSADYTSFDGAHLRGLPVRKWVSSDEAGADANRVSLTTYGYDEFPLATCPDIFGNEVANCPNISGHDPAYGTNRVARGNQTSVTDFADAAAGAGPVTTSARYDLAGNVVKAVNALNRQMFFDFRDNFGAPDGEARSNTAPAELASQPQQTYAYALPRAVRDAAGYVSYMQYDYYLGRPVDGEDINNVHTVLRYDDPLDRLKLGVRALGTAEQSQTTIAYNDAGRTITVSSDLNHYNDNLLKSEIVYDGLGRTTQSRQYETATQYILNEKKYDALGRDWAASNPYRPTLGEAPVWTTTAYDGLGRVSSVTTPDGAKSYTLYHGARTLTTDPALVQQLSRTDALGRLVEVWEVRTPDAATGTEQVSFPVPEGSVIPQVSDGYRTGYSYDLLGNLTGVSQRVGTSGTLQQRAFFYDSLSRLTSAKNPESGTVNYKYDAGGNLILKIDSRPGGAPLPNCSIPYAGGSVATCYAYDALNRIRSRTYNDGTPNVSYSYDDPNVPNSTGMLTSVSGGASVYNYSAFDEQGRITASSQTTDGQTYALGYEYDLAGHLTRQTYPSGRSVVTSYDRAGRPSGVTGQKAGEAGKTYASSFDYAAHGAVASLRLGNGLWEHALFNGRLQPTQVGLGASASDSSVLKLDYTYGKLVNGQLDPKRNNDSVQSQRITAPGLDLTQSYEYDALDRLQSAREANNASPCRDQNSAPTDCWRQVYHYDRYGNRTFDSGTTFPSLPSNLADMVSNPKVDPATNRLVEYQDGDSVKDYQYDAAGNVTRNAVGQTFAYDAENKQTSYNGGASSAAGGADYFYDSDGRRVKKVTPAGTTVFVYDAAGMLVAEYSSEAPQPGSGGTKYLTEDNLGSPRVITDQSGKVVSRHDYAPFGEELFAGRTTDYKQDSVRQQFTGYEKDKESGLDYAQARYYSSALGRFTTVDPMAASARTDNPKSWNRYVYVLNNPVKLVDPSGQCTQGQICSPGFHFEGTTSTRNYEKQRLISCVTRGGEPHYKEVVMEVGRTDVVPTNQAVNNILSQYADAVYENEANTRSQMNASREANGAVTLDKVDLNVSIEGGVNGKEAGEVKAGAGLTLSYTLHNQNDIDAARRDADNRLEVNVRQQLREVQTPASGSGGEPRHLTESEIDGLLGDVRAAMTRRAQEEVDKAAELRRKSDPRQQ